MNYIYVSHASLFGQGLCNKLHSLFAACCISIANNVVLIEPEFGWTRPVLFSTIYDIDYFNRVFHSYTGGRDIMVRRNEIPAGAVIYENNVKLFDYNELILYRQRKECIIRDTDMSYIVLRALKLNSCYDDILSKYNVQYMTAVHIRIENDWIRHSKDQTIKENELYLINIHTLFDMYKNDGNFSTRLFFTTGENQKDVIDALTTYGYTGEYYYDENLEYEVNAAINFELCVRAKEFIGLTRSTYSNLITQKRSMLGKEDSYIYNYNGKIYPRIDAGLQPEPYDSVHKKTNIMRM